MNARQFKIHQIDGQIQKIFIAEYNNRILLLDGGCKCDVHVIENFIIYKLNRKISDIKLLLVTHIHPDHAAAAPVLREKYKIPIAAFHSIDKWYAGIGGFFQHIVDILLAHYVVIKLKQPFKSLWYGRKIKPDYELYDNDMIPFFEDWKILHVPGHTTHDIIAYNKSKQLLYAADLILYVNKQFTLPIPVPIPELMQKSLKRIGQIRTKKIFMAHGGTLDVKSISGITGELLIRLWKKPSLGARIFLYLFTRFPSEIRKAGKI